MVALDANAEHPAWSPRPCNGGSMVGGEELAALFVQYGQFGFK